ncbi:hypothetical protein C1H46_004277 [Malus baccata]|uniref:Uncharacterized protein n=1 Tax=Malus baccata TaxID=106549 RepID=A0A540NGE3_MALBA|nr:hypothetical protein C1H46_004277 [Malus baccata]
MEAEDEEEMVDKEKEEMEVEQMVEEECRSNEFPIKPNDESSSSQPLLVSEEDLDQDFQTQEQQRNIANEWRYIT